MTIKTVWTRIQFELRNEDTRERAGGGSGTSRKQVKNFFFAPHALERKFDVSGW